MSHPWRTVVHIEDKVGPKGGPYWRLTLECGHLAFRRRWNPTPEQFVSSLVSPLVAMDKMPRRRRLDAPQRLRCLHCEAPDDLPSSR